MKKKILIALACVIAVIGVLCGIYFPESNINNSISEVQNTITSEIQTIEKETNQNEIIISQDTEEIVRDTIQATEEGEDLSTTEVIESTVVEEEQIIDEGAIESDAVVEQENIAYNGTSTGSGLSLLGNYQGLTYYSQADSRWANVMYSSINDKSQTMKSSSCRTDKCCYGGKL